MHDLVTMVWKELIQVSNRARFVWQKATIAAVLAAVFLLMAWDGIYSQPQTYQNMAHFGRTFYLTLLAILTVVLSLTAMAFGSDIVISEIVRRRLPLLLVTPLSAPAIVGSKMVSVFGRVFVGLLISFPFVAFLQIFGGVDRQMVILGAVFVLSNVWFYGTLGVACSVVSRTTTRALGLAAGLALFWNLLPLFYAIYLAYLANASGGRGMPGLGAMSPFAISPFFCWFVFVQGVGGPFTGGGGLTTVVSIHGTVNALIGAAFAAIAFLAFRPVARRLVAGAPERRRRHLTREKKKDPSKRVETPRPMLPRLSERLDNCIVDRELGRWRIWRITLPLAWLFVPWVVVLLVGSFDGYPEFGEPKFEQTMFVIEACGFLCLVSLISATRIAKEKEARTFQALVLTRMGAARILAGKVAAVIVGQAVPCVFLVAHLALVMWLAVASPVDIAVIPAGLLVSILYSVTIGAYFSLSSKTAAQAVIMTTIAWFLGAYAGMLPVAWLSRVFGFASDDKTGAAILIFPLAALAVISIAVTASMSRRQGFGSWLSLFSYSAVSSLLYTSVSAMIEPSLSTDVWGYAAFLPAASLVPWDSKIQGVSVPYMILPVQIGVLIWMVWSILMSFEGQARREH